jgi:SOS response regulatory protein OraA/RecX
MPTRKRPPTKPRKPKPRENNDTPWKQILRDYFPQAIQFFFPELAVTIDWSRGYQFLDKEFAQIAPKAAQGNRYVDKLAKVWRLDGASEWLLIHIEVQGRKETVFPHRMLTYGTRILDRYGVLATSLAILCDSNPTWRPTTCEVTGPLSKLTFEFASIKLLDYKQDEAALQQSDNPFAWIVLAHLKTQATKRNPQARKAWKFSLMRQLYDRGMSAQDIRNLYNFIDWTMMLPEDLDMAFWQELKTFEEDQQMAYVTSAERFGRKIGVEEGLKKGLKKGETQNARKVALKMLQEGFDRDTICRLTELSIAQLEALAAENA